MTKSRSPYHKKMVERNQGEWLVLIRKIKNKKLRMKAAAVIWWDWFAPYNRRSLTLKSEFVAFMDCDNYLEIEADLYIELVRMGYKESKARIRSKLPRPELSKKTKTKE